MWLVLDTAWNAPFAIESNFARDKRWAVAFSASVGWITVVDADGMSYGRTWRITSEGLVALQHQRRTEKA